MTDVFIQIWTQRKTAEKEEVMTQRRQGSLRLPDARRETCEVLPHIPKKELTLLAP